MGDPDAIRLQGLLPVCLWATQNFHGLPCRRGKKVNMPKQKFNAKILRKERMDAGYTLQSFAEALKFHTSLRTSKAHVWSWERLGVQPGGTYLMAISNVLGKPIEYF